MGVVYYNEIIISLSTGDTGISCDVHFLEPWIFNAMLCLKQSYTERYRIIDQSNGLAHLINVIN